MDASGLRTPRRVMLTDRNGAGRREHGGVFCRMVYAMANSTVRLTSNQAAVAASSVVSQVRAWVRSSPHISADACNPAQQAGRSGRPNIAQRNSSVRCRQGSPAGLPRVLIEGAMQQAPQPGRHSITASSADCFGAQRIPDFLFDHVEHQHRGREHFALHFLAGGLKPSLGFCRDFGCRFAVGCGGQ